MAEPARNQDAIDLLRSRFGARLSTSAAVREQHGRDESYHAPQSPDAVVFAHSTNEVVEIVRICAANGAPVIAFGAVDKALLAISFDEKALPLDTI